MASDKKLHEIYAERMMKRHDYGYPFYEPPSDAEVFPGKCGYVDQHGKWNPIVDLTESDTVLISLGFTELGATLQKAPKDQSIAWGPKYSDSVSGKQFDLKAGVSAESFGVPATASCVYQISSKSDYGAVLMTEPNVWRDRYYHDSPFENWVRRNSDALARIRPEIKKYGLWAVKETYTTKKCALNSWTSKDKAVTIGFQATAVPVGEVAPSGKWYESSSDGGWIKSSTTEDSERRVVFMGGIYFRWHRMAKTGKHLKPKDPLGTRWTFRSGEATDNNKVKIDDEEFEMTCERIGNIQASDEEECDENGEVF